MDPQLAEGLGILALFGFAVLGLVVLVIGAPWALIAAITRRR